MILSIHTAAHKFQGIWHPVLTLRVLEHMCANIYMPAKLYYKGRNAYFLQVTVSWRCWIWVCGRGNCWGWLAPQLTLHINGQASSVERGEYGGSINSDHNQTEMLWRWTPQYKQDFELALETDPRLHKNRLAEWQTWMSLTADGDRKTANQWAPKNFGGSLGTNRTAETEAVFEKWMEMHTPERACAIQSQPLRIPRTWVNADWRASNVAQQDISA